jgi:hypothetical protein
MFLTEAVAAMTVALKASTLWGIGGEPALNLIRCVD